MQKEDWECPRCGRREGGRAPHKEIYFGTEYEDKPEITVDITCETVYFLRNDGYGVALDHDEFEEVVELFKDAQDAMKQ